MKWYEKLYGWGLLTIFIGVTLHTPLSVWLGTKFPEYSLLIKSWKELLMFALIALAVVIVSRHKLWGEFAKDWIFRLIVAYAVVHVLLVLLFWSGPVQAFAGIGIDLRYVLFFGLVYTLIRAVPSFKPLFVKAAVAGAAIIVGFATLQIVLPADILANIGYSDQTIKPYQTVDENDAFIRVNSTLRGPNPLGAYAGAVLILLLAYIMTQQKKLKKLQTSVLIGLLSLCSIIALWLSYSRSAVVAPIIGAAVVVLAVKGRRIHWRVWAGVGAALLCIVIGVIAARDTSFVQTVVFHDNPTTGAEVTSNDDHASSLETGFSRMVVQPLGAGIGSTGSASLFGNEGIIIENQYLFIAHETGWIGLALYMAIFVLIMIRLYKKRRDWMALGVFASGISLALIGTLLPVWTDDTVAIIWWGMAALAIGGKNGRQ